MSAISKFHFSASDEILEQLTPIPMYPEGIYDKINISTREPANVFPVNDVFRRAIDSSATTKELVRLNMHSTALFNKKYAINKQNKMAYKVSLFPFSNNMLPQDISVLVGAIGLLICDYLDTTVNNTVTREAIGAVPINVVIRKLLATFLPYEAVQATWTDESSGEDAVMALEMEYFRFDFVEFITQLSGTRSDFTVAKELATMAVLLSTSFAMPMHDGTSTVRIDPLGVPTPQNSKYSLFLTTKPNLVRVIGVMVVGTAWLREGMWYEILNYDMRRRESMLQSEAYGEEDAFLQVRPSTPVQYNTMNTYGLVRSTSSLSLSNSSEADTPQRKGTFKRLFKRRTGDR